MLLRFLVSPHFVPCFFLDNTMTFYVSWHILSLSLSLSLVFSLKHDQKLIKENPLADSKQDLLWTCLMNWLVFPAILICQSEFSDFLFACTFLWLPLLNFYLVPVQYPSGLKRFFGEKLNEKQKISEPPARAIWKELIEPVSSHITSDCFNL